MVAGKMNNICLIVSSVHTAEVFLLDQLSALSSRYNVTLVANTNNPAFLEQHGIKAKVIPVPIERRIHPLKDFAALYCLYKLFRKNAFDSVHSVTPKAGLLSMIAGALARVPVRIHTFTGQVWGTRTGIMSMILKKADQVTARLATHILIDSSSQRDFLLQEGIVSENRSLVLAKGSISGVDTYRFKPDVGVRKKMRSLHEIPATSLVFLYMARLTRDKGALVMAEAFSEFAECDSQAHILIVGPDEEGLRPVIGEICRLCADRIHFADFTSVPEEYMASADILCLPSYREGFGTVLINAASVGIPAIASRIYGSVDAIVEGVTGLLHEVGNVSDLVSKMKQLSNDPSLREKMGENGRLRVLRDFSEEVVTAALLDYYKAVLVNPSGVSYRTD
jgi:glycosyltransferase involved in cell wall biosynthesis